MLNLKLFFVQDKTARNGACINGNFLYPLLSCMFDLDMKVIDLTLESLLFFLHPKRVGKYCILIYN